MGDVMFERENLYRRIQDAAVKDFFTAYDKSIVDNSAFGIGDQDDAGISGVELEIWAGRKWATPFRTSWTFKHFANGKQVTAKEFIAAIPV